MFRQNPYDLTYKWIGFLHNVEDPADGQIFLPRAGWGLLRRTERCLTGWAAGIYIRTGV